MRTKRAPSTGNSPLREPVEQLEVEGDADLGVGQRAVPINQLGVWFVEGAAVAVGPQGVDVVAGDGRAA
ncbi:hypothetical protein [Streptomyces prasinus]|uniref:hypothetical protein n=1 Tax=Streptomyces prasinus TaxID=67345 RepID=UPI0036B74435